MASRQMVFAALVLLAGPAGAQDARHQAQQGAGDPVSNAASKLEGQGSDVHEVAGPADMPVRMPSTPESMPFELQDNLVRIPATVNGQAWSAVLDSGVGALLADQAVARRLGLVEAESELEASGAGARSTPLRPVTLGDLTFGPLKFDTVASYSADLSQLSLSAGFPVDILIGAPAFKYGAVTVDYPRRRVTFGPSGSAGTCAAPIPLEITNDAPVAEVQFRPTPDAAPVRLKMLVDLGTRHFAVAMGGPFLRTEAGQALFQSGVARQVGHGIGGGVEGRVAQVTGLRLGSLDLGSVDVAMSANVPAFETGFIDGTLGVPLWQAGVITFDYPARELCIALPG